ncbi:MAG: T9SS type A sorting domain-containing protein [Flavobacterium sp.]|nr:T9SS type A sorting domain-containing protein [Flavobacterium sp.]
MKKITLWLFAIFTCWQLEAQIGAYTFSQSTGSYTEITGETVLATQTTASGTAATSLDDVNYTIVLPFDFTFNGSAYLMGSNLYVNTNGFISIGTTSPIAGVYGPIGNTGTFSNAFSPFGLDLNGGYAAVGTNVSGSPDLTITSGLASEFVVGAVVSGTGIPVNTTVVSVTGATVTLSANCTSGGTGRTFHVAIGKISYVLSGTAPNRSLTIQYKRIRPYNTTLRTLDFQIILNETTNTVSFVYGNAVGSTTSSTPQVGLRGANNTLFNNRTSTTDWSATTAGATNTATITFSSTVLPTSGLTYTWTPPNCAAPSGFNATSVLATTATLNWNAIVPSPSVGYEYFYSTVNTTPTVAGTATTATTANLTGLTANTLYYVWLRSDCGGTQSAWGGPFTFRTNCTVASAPWTYDVESATVTTNSTVTDCWSSNPTATTTAFRWDVTGTGTTPSAGTGASVANSGVKYFYTEATSGTTGAIAELYSPLVDVSALTVPSLQFYYHMFGVAMGELHIDVYNGSTWTNDVDVIIGQQQTIQTDPWLNRIVNLSAYSGIIQVRFRGIRGTDFTGDISLDDIRIVEAPTCIPPTNLLVNNITTTSASMNWTENGSAFDWEYVLQAPGTGVPSGLGTPIDTQPFSITGLMSNTNYEIYIRSVCSFGDKSSWVGPVTFRTPCVAYTIPYFEGFESGYVQDASVSGCLSQESITGTQVWSANTSLTDYNRTPRTGSWNAYLRYGNEDWIFIPIDLVGGTSYTMQFYARQDGATATNANVLASYGTTATSAGMTNVIVPSTGIVNGNYQQFVGTFTPATSGTYYVGIKGFMNFSPWYISIDDISINVTPACQDPFGLTVSNLSSTAADLSWSATSGNYEYVLDNLVANPTGSGIATTALTYNASGLTPSTVYYFHLRTDCGAGTFSNWTTLMFTTAPSPPANDLCTAAQVLTIGGVFVDNEVIGTNVGATNSTVPDPLCANYLGGDVWYQVTIPTSGSVIIETNSNGTTLNDTGMAVYSGNCGNLLLIECDDDDSLDGLFSLISLSGRTAGELIHVRVWEYGNDVFNQFKISAYDASLSSSSFNVAGFRVYPNPVKDILTLEYTTSISSVKIINLLGQEVISRNVNDNETKIDMSQLNSGAYIVNVIIDDTVQSIKVIKE